MKQIKYKLNIYILYSICLISILSSKYNFIKIKHDKSYTINKIIKEKLKKFVESFEKSSFLEKNISYIGKTINKSNSNNKDTIKPNLEVSPTYLGPIAIDNSFIDSCLEKNKSNFSEQLTCLCKGALVGNKNFEDFKNNKKTILKNMEH